MNFSCGEAVLTIKDIVYGMDDILLALENFINDNEIQDVQYVEKLYTIKASLDLTQNLLYNAVENLQYIYDEYENIE